jgi:uncharacterized iron-regulated membrane protein
MSFKRSIRKYHRYLGLIIGIQFLFWTLGGLYFSWTNIEEIRGNTLKKEASFFSNDFQIAKLSPHLDSLKQLGVMDSIKSIKLTKLLNHQAILITYFTSAKEIPKENRLLIDLSTNKAIPEISAELANKIAQKSMKNPVEIVSTQRLSKNDINSRHEFRSGVLPAYLVHMNTKNNLHIYIDAKSGEVLKYRTQKWRIFDFLWMTHTMDYASRDNLNNWLLRAFSILGLLTILSGFTLYFNTSRRFRKKKSI